MRNRLAAMVVLLLLTPALGQALAPRPELEAALRRQIEGWENKQPLFAEMTPALAERQARRRAEFQKLFNDLGALKSITFLGRESLADVYQVQFEKGALEWSIFPLRDGKIDLVAFTPVTVRQDKGPSPGLADAIRRVLEGNLAGKTVFEIMSPAVQARTRQQWDGITADAKRLGALQGISFLMIDARGGDQYLATFANGVETVSAEPLAEGKFTSLVLGNYLLLHAPPHPGTRDWLLRHIAAMSADQPDYQNMQPTLENVIRQAPLAQSSVQGLGPLRSMRFQGGGANDTDVYLATFQNGKMEWRIQPPDGAGRVGVLASRILN